MKTKLLFIVLLCTISSSSLSAQVGVGTTLPKGALDVDSPNSGMLVPRMQLTSYTIAAPVTNPQTGALVNGTLVYNLGPAAPDNMPAGFYYWNVTKWEALAGGSTPTNEWKTTGNAGLSSANFLGTTDAVDLYFRSGGSNKFRLPAATNQILGYGGTAASPTYGWESGAGYGMWLSGGANIRFSTGTTSRFQIPNADQVHAMALGTAALPFYSWSGDTNTGIFSPGADQLGFSTSGTSRFQIPNANQVHAMSLGTAALPFYSWSADTNTGLFSPGADQMAIATNGTEKVRVIATGQVGIGTITPNAALDITSATNGFVAPRIDLSATNVASPVVNPNGGGTPLAGTIVYNGVTAGVVPNNVTPGYYYWDGAKWVRMAGGASTPHNTLDMAYDEGGAGVGRTIVADAGAVVISSNSADSALDIINTSTTLGISGQYNAVINDGTIGVVANINVDGVGVLIDNNDTNNQYSGLQVTTYSNNATSAGIFPKTEALSPAIAVEGGSVDNSVATPNAMTVTNFRTNGGAAIDATAAIGIRSTSQTDGGSAYSGYLNATVGAAAQFNGASTAALTTSSLITGNHRFGVVSQGNLVGTYSTFTNSTLGAAFEGRINSVPFNFLYAARVGGANYDIYFKSAQTRQAKTLIANVIGAGVNATTIKKDNASILMPAVSAPESLFQDYGTGTLYNGRATVSIHPILTENILVDDTHQLKVFVQLEGECNGVYVTNKSSSGFEVIELNNGKSNVSFSYSIIATRASQDVVDENGAIVHLDYSGRFFGISNEQTETKLLEDKKVETKPMKRMINARKEIKKETK